MTPEAIAEVLLANPTGPLCYAVRPELARALAERMHRSSGGTVDLDAIKRVAAVDYRLIAVALHLARAGHAANRALWHAPADPETEFLVDAALSPPADPRPLRRVSDLDELFAAEDPALWVLAPEHESGIDAFLGRCAGRPGRSIERRLDRPSHNAVNRDGIVKSWALTADLRVISKRDNRRKLGRLERELRSISRVVGRLGGEREAFVDIDGAAVAVHQPICVLSDPDTRARYAIWPEIQGTALDDLLLGASLEASERARHLESYRRCLDALFDRGIVWRDMSPRNILVDETGGYTLYHLVDFEKTDFADAPLEQAARVSACRTQFCVEEFGVLCVEEELMHTFDGLFAPDEWDLDDDAPLPWPPRTEIAAILAGRGIDQVATGLFNRLDQALRAIRSPRRDSRTGDLARPGLLGFRIEHYLSLSNGIDSDDYDRKASEVLLAALESGVQAMLDMARDLGGWADLLEDAVVIAEFDAILASGHSASMRYPEREARALTDAIDRRYQAARA